jgi:hypothetical protein
MHGADSKISFAERIQICYLAGRNAILTLSHQRLAPLSEKREWFSKAKVTANSDAKGPFAKINSEGVKL